MVYFWSKWLQIIVLFLCLITEFYLFSKNSNIAKLINNKDTATVDNPNKTNIGVKKMMSEDDLEQHKMKEIDKLIQKKIQSRKIHENVAAKTNRRKPFTIDDFNLLKLIGRGSYGQVFLVTAKTDRGECYAMKAVKKDQVLENDEMESVMLERDACKLGNQNRFLTRLISSFHNEVNFWFSYIYEKFLLV